MMDTHSIELKATRGCVSLKADTVETPTARIINNRMLCLACIIRDIPRVVGREAKEQPQLRASSMSNLLTMLPRPHGALPETSHQ